MIKQTDENKKDENKNVTVDDSIKIDTSIIKQEENEIRHTLR